MIVDQLSDCGKGLPEVFSCNYYFRYLANMMADIKNVYSLIFVIPSFNSVCIAIKQFYYIVTDYKPTIIHAESKSLYLLHIFPPINEKQHNLSPDTQWSRNI